MHIIHDFILVLIIFAITSCGMLIKNNDDITIVDSNGRAHKVLDEDNKELGKTPFFHKIERKRYQTFYLLDPESKLELKYKCSFDFSEAIIPDILTTALLFPYGILTLGVDWYKGTLYKCKNPIFFNNKFSYLSPNESARVLIIPPTTKSFTTSNIIENQFVGKKFKNTPNIKIIKLDVELASIGITPYSENTLKNINLHLLHPILREYQITHLLFFDINAEKDKLIATPKLVDAFTKKDIPINLNPIVIENKQVNSIDNFLDKFHFLPNSINLSQNNIGNDNSGVIYEHHPKAFPKFITSFSLGNVYVPHLYASWDFDFYSTTSFSLPTWKNTILNKEYLFQSTVGTLDGGLLIKTPLGAISAEIGYGGIYFYQKPSEINSKFQTCIEYSFSYVFYFTSKIFFKLQAQEIIPSSTNIQGKKISIHQTSIGIGYYIPGLEGIFRDNI